jgi:hypothetical protein
LITSSTISAVIEPGFATSSSSTALSFFARFCSMKPLI